MKKSITIILAILSIVNLSAQYEGNLKIGQSINSDLNNFIGGKAGLHTQLSFGYRF